MISLDTCAGESEKSTGAGGAATAAAAAAAAISSCWSCWIVELLLGELLDGPIVQLLVVAL
jgi:hypothetical protein